MPDFTFDAWANKTPEELQADCRRLSRALYRWQHIAMRLATTHGVEKLPEPYRSQVRGLLAAYDD